MSEDTIRNPEYIPAVKFGMVSKETLVRYRRNPNDPFRCIVCYVRSKRHVYGYLCRECRMRFRLKSESKIGGIGGDDGNGDRNVVEGEVEVEEVGEVGERYPGVWDDMEELRKELIRFFNGGSSKLTFK